MKETVPHHSKTNLIVECDNRIIFAMNRTILAGSKLPKGMWNYASAWSPCTQNGVPHTILKGASPVKIPFPETDQTEQRKNLRKFVGKVTCFDYLVKDKQSPRSFDGRLVAYTHTHGVYKVIDQQGAIKLAKSTKAIQDNDEEEEPLEEEYEELPPIPTDEPHASPERAPTISSPPAPRKKRRH